MSNTYVDLCILGHVIRGLKLIHRFISHLMILFIRYHSVILESAHPASPTVSPDGKTSV